MGGWTGWGTVNVFAMTFVLGDNVYSNLSLTCTAGWYACQHAGNLDITIPNNANVCSSLLPDATFKQYLILAHYQDRRYTVIHRHRPAVCCLPCSPLPPTFVC